MNLYTITVDFVNDFCNGPMRDCLSAEVESVCDNHGCWRTVTVLRKTPTGKVKQVTFAGYGAVVIDTIGQER